MLRSHKLLAAFLWIGSLVLAGSPEQEGLRIARLADEANNGFMGEYSEMEMVLINAYKDRTTRKLITEIRETEKDGDQAISTFLWPADVKGTRMLTWSHKTGDDDQWLYLPALKRVKRISSRNKSGAFMGSEFSYEDLGSQEVEEYRHRFLEEVEFKGRKCWKLERVPVNKKSGYSKEISWLDQEYMNPVQVEYYDRKGDLLKVASFEGYRKIEQWWRTGKIVMKNVQTQKESILTWNTRELGKKFDKYYFTSDSLVE